MKQNLLKTVLVGTALVAGSLGGWADEVTLQPTQTTMIHANSKTATDLESKVYYDAAATTWYCSYSTISGGAFKNALSNYDGTPVVLTKFDATSALEGKHLVKATLKFTSQCTVSGKNSNVQVASVNTGWDATTATWTNTNTAAVLNAVNINGDGVNVNSTAREISVDVTSYLKDNMAGFGFYTMTGREQAISNITLTIENSTEAAKPFKYEVNLVDENNKVLKSVYSNDALTLGTVVNYSYPKYLTDENGKVTHVCEAKTFTGSIAPSEAGSTDIKYSAFNGNAFFVEAESAINATNMESANYSSGVAVRGFNKDKNLFTIPENGLYRLTYAVCNNRGSDTRQLIISADDKEIVNKDINWSVNYILLNGIISEEPCAFTKGTVIKAKGSDTNIILDYVLLEKVGDAVPVTDLKYASYVPTVNVAVPSDVKVYTGKVNEAKNAIDLTEIPAGTVIPAGAAVLVGGDAATYSFAASTEDAAAITDNELKPATAETVGDGKTIYALAKVADKPVFALVKEGVAVGEGHAYITISGAAGARFYSIGAGNGETTGINQVNGVSAEADGAYYTLQGMKTSKPAKGIYIHNGKKVIVNK